MREARYTLDLLAQHTNGMANLITNADVEQVVNPQRYYDWCEEHHKRLMDRSKRLLELYHSLPDVTIYDPDEILDDAMDSSWKAAEFAWDNQSFIQDYQKEHPELTYKFWKESDE